MSLPEISQTLGTISLLNCGNILSLSAYMPEQRQSYLHWFIRVHIFSIQSRYYHTEQNFVCPATLPKMNGKD